MQKQILNYMNPNELYEILEADFTEKNQRISIGVKRIFNILTASDHFLSAHEIAKLDENKLNHSTVYRILDKFQKAKIVHEFQGKWKICTDPENTDESHHFLICQECGKSDEIFLDYFNAISEQLNEEKGFELKQVHLGFLGVCEECREK